MALSKLIAHFSDQTEFPVLVDDVRDWLIRQGLQDEIYFFPVDMIGGDKILKGQVKQYTRHDVPYGDPIFVTNIMYADMLNICWRRIVCCKEMVHILDGPECKTATPEEIEKLTLDLTSPKSEGDDAFYADRAALLKALCILAPLKAIDRLRDQYESEQLTDKEVATLFRVPEVYIDFLFSDAYRASYQRLMQEGITLVRKQKA